jgi:hypothetical protein
MLGSLLEVTASTCTVQTGYLRRASTPYIRSVRCYSSTHINKANTAKQCGAVQCTRASIVLKQVKQPLSA